MWLEVLFTVLSLCALVVCALLALDARESAIRAGQSEHRLSIMRGQVKGLEVGLTALDESHKKLAGRVYADQYWRGQRDEQPELQPSTAVCENWARSQTEGPMSAAARCECDYCEGKRADRAKRRASMRSGVKS